MPPTAVDCVLPPPGVEDSDPVRWLRLPARHSRSFFFASRWLPSELQRPVAGIYAFSRLTGELVHRPDAGVDRKALVAAWRDAAWRAWRGEAVGHPLVECVMADSRAHGVSFRHVECLLRGIEMEADGRDYDSLRQLEGYTRAVSGSVGGWLAERAGVRDDGVLERAYELGHALQLTNIVRDVGVDLERGRCYLPATLLGRHEVDRGGLDEVRSRPDAPLPVGYATLMEELMDEADASYESALDAVVALPGTFSRAAIVAARVYQGIHGALRRAGHDSLRHRVHTGRLEKATLAAGALAELARMDRVRNPHARRVSGSRA